MTAHPGRWRGGPRRGWPLPSPARARALERRRESLVGDCLRLGARLWNGDRAKLYSGTLSAGCAACVRGEWGYVELHRLCPLRCFYCPRPQRTLSDPFERIVGLPAGGGPGFARLAGRLGYGGIGLSGGEPLLAMGRLLSFTRALGRLRPRIPVWAYTSGALADERRLKALRAAGLGELRFDISARGYDLSAVRRAARILPAVAVEIPAVPEDAPLLRRLLPEIAAAGASRLNLHQLTGTPHNEAAFRARGYLAAEAGPLESPRIIDSELCALETLRDALRRKLPLSINYCSFVFKRRYHSWARRRHLACAAGEREVTSAGWIRRRRGADAEYLQYQPADFGPGPVSLRLQAAGRTHGYRLEAAARRPGGRTAGPPWEELPKADAPYREGR